MRNITIPNNEYSFNPATGEVSITGTYESLVTGESLKFIANQTRGVELYNPLCGVLGTVDGSKITVVLDTTAMSSSDTLWVQLSLKEASLTGLGGDELKVQDANSHLLSEILTELRINNECLFSMKGERFTEEDIVK